MRIFDLFGRLRALALAVAVAAAVGIAIPGQATASPRFTSPEEALRQGIGAYNGGYYEIALPALQHAAAKNLFLGSYYLAALYADNNSPYTDHGKAYLLYLKIANEHADVDPDHDARAPYVAKALRALANYVRSGLSDIRLKANPRLAAEYLHHAALFFNDEDAQFELSKMQLSGEGVQLDVARGRHWLAVLAEKGHAGAQAFLADLYWRGKFLPKDQLRALALISVAVKNAPASEKVWIDDIYQNIYCGASEGVLAQATGMVADWDVRYGRKPPMPGRSALGGLDIGARRVCADGRAVPMHEGQLPFGPPPAPAVEAGVDPAAHLPGPRVPNVASEQGADDEPTTFMRGNVGGGTMRPAGVRR
jgi:exopolysaccharide production negative regulator